MKLTFGLKGLGSIAPSQIWYTPSAIRVVYTNTSTSGYGGYLVEHGCHVATGQWPENDGVKSSTWCELRVVLLV